MISYHIIILTHCIGKVKDKATADEQQHFAADDFGDTTGH